MSFLQSMGARALSRASWVLGATAVVLCATPVVAAPPASHWLLAQDFAARARDVRLGEKLRVEDVPLEPAANARRVPALGGFSAESGTLDLERIEVFARGPVIVLHHGNRETRREAPDTAYFAGRIEGRAGSFAFLSIDRDGGTRGLISDAEGTWRIGTIGRTPNVEALDPNEPFADTPAPWTCANESLPVLPARIAAQGDLARVAAADTVYVADIALETDAEFYDMFGSADDAIAYIGDLFAAISAIYQRDVGTLLRVSYLSLWPGALNSDPWNATTTSAGLSEFETYWRNNRGSVPRSTAHFLSGKPTGGGIAYVGALCSTFYGFGFTGSLNGAFSTTSPLSSTLGS